MKRYGRRLALNDQPRFGNLARHFVGQPLGRVHSLVRCRINVGAAIAQAVRAGARNPRSMPWLPR